MPRALSPRARRPPQQVITRQPDRSHLTRGSLGSGWERVRRDRTRRCGRSLRRRASASRSTITSIVTRPSSSCFDAATACTSIFGPGASCGYCRLPVATIDRRSARCHPPPTTLTPIAACPADRSRPCSAATSNRNSATATACPSTADPEGGLRAGRRVLPAQRPQPRADPPDERLAGPQAAPGPTCPPSGPSGGGCPAARRPACGGRGCRADGRSPRPATRPARSSASG